MFKKIILKIIKLYIYVASPYLGGNCKYTPSCSNYGYKAVEKHGAIIGSLMIFSRLFRCNPFSKGGYDPVRWKLF